MTELQLIHNDPQAEDAIEMALHELAHTTTVDAAFATLLETRLLTQAEMMQTGAEPLRKEAWWQQQWRLLQMPRYQGLRLRYGFAILVLVVAGLLLSTPIARATLREWLYSFGLIEERQVANRPFGLERPMAEMLVPLTLGEIQAQAPFTIALPRQLPTGLIYTGGFVETTTAGTQVTLAYHLSAKQAMYPPDAPLLFVLISDGRVENQPLLAQDQVIPVQIEGMAGQTTALVGMYAHGGWRTRRPMTPQTTTVADLYWDPTVDEAWLSWQANQLNYLLYAQGLGIEQVALVTIAQSMSVE